MELMLSKDLETTLRNAFDEARRRRHEFVTLEHVLFVMVRDPVAAPILLVCGADLERLSRDLDLSLGQLERLPEGVLIEPEQTAAFWRVLQQAASYVQSAGKRHIEAGHVLAAIFAEKDSNAVFLMERMGVTRLSITSYLAHGVVEDEPADLPAQPQGEEEEDDERAPRRSPLESYTADLVKLAEEGRIDPLIGRAAELERIVQVLCRRRKNNPLLVGEPGVGKTAVVEGLALAIHQKTVPPVLAKARIFALDMGALIAGTKFRGQFEDRLKGVVKALEEIPDAVLFIDEIHTIIGAGATNHGAMDAANLLKPALASGRLRCIGSTTFNEYKAFFDKDRALARRFQQIDILEPSLDETVEILKGLRGEYEKHHEVAYSDDALEAAVALSAKYITERQLPDKAIDVVDEAGALDRLRPGGRTGKVDVADIEGVVSKMARVPARSVNASDEQALADLAPRLKKVLYGQDAAVDAVVSAILLNRSGLGHEGKPIGSFLFSGPTGVGKTELARQLAEVMGVQFLRFDMSEYMEKHTVSRLIGAPPGYVGFDQGGLLTDAVRKAPHAVVVLDEIEKAHPDVYNLLLQVMDHATLTDNSGRQTDFRHVVLIMTTNAGALDLNARALGFSPAGSTVRAAAGDVGKEAIERTFSPEFRNRLDAWIPFAPLGRDTILRVVDKFIDELQRQLADRNVSISITPAAKDWLAEHGFDPQYGARPMRRLIQDRIRKPLSEQILFGPLKSGGQVRVDIDGDGLGVRLI